MQAFTFDPMRWRTIRVFGTSPLVRTSDRIEAIVVVSAVAISLLAASFVGAIGTAVYDARTRVYVEEAQKWRPTSATVTKAWRVTGARPYMDTAIVEARWHSRNVEHTESFSTKGAVTVGDQIDIWINDDGARVQPPSRFQAAIEAVFTAVPLWLVVVGAATALVALVRRRLDRRHDADWDREIGSLAERRSAD